METKRMEIIRIILKVILWFLVIEFGCNFVMQTVSYSFYKRAHQKKDVAYTPQYLQMTDTLTGYGYHLDKDAGEIILYFGGSDDIAYNSVGTYAGKFDCPFLCADYYGTQKSKGKMNLKTMQQTAIGLYDYAKKQYPGRKIIVIGHSYASGIAAFLASERKCDALFLAAAYRDISDLYNKMTPVFWGPLKVFISNNIALSDYAKNVTCPVFVIGSNADTTLSASLQKKVAACFSNAKLKIFENIRHENYFVTEDVIEYVKQSVSEN